MKTKALFAVLVLLIMIALPASASEPGTEDENVTDAEQEYVSEDDVRREISRQTGELDLTEWQEYYDELSSFARFGSGSVWELVEGYSQRGAADEPQSLWQIAIGLIRSAFSGVRGTIAALTAAGLITGLAEALPKGGMRKPASMLLSALSAALLTSVFASLCSTAIGSIDKLTGFTEAALPVMTVLLSAIGASSSVGALRPLMLFLSGSVMLYTQKLVIPLILAGGVVGILDGVCGEGRLTGVFKLFQSAVKWLIGISAVLYTGICAVQGMTASAADGVSIRTAKYAIDRLLPSTGGLIGGSVDTFMSCALLVKNGAGVAALIIMLGILAKPMATLAAGVFALKICAALLKPVSAQSTANMLEHAAEMAAQLFAAAAVTGAMFAVTVLVFITAGGSSIGLW